MIRETIVPAIPDLRGDNLKDVVTALKSTLDVREGRVGDPLDQAVTLRDLTDLNLALSGGSTSTASGGSLPVLAMLPPAVSGYNAATDFTTPPAPTGLRATGGFTNVYLAWDGAPYRNHSYTEIWRAAVDNLAQATLIGTTAASAYADPATPDSTYFYWIRFVSRANVTGPYNQTSGTAATTALDVSAALSAITGELERSQLFIDLGRRVERIETDAYIQNLTSGVYKSQLDQLSAATASINSQITSLRAVNGNTATLLTDLRTRSGKQPVTFFQDAAPASNANYTLAIDDIWYDTNDNNKRYRWTGSSWQEQALTVAVYRQQEPPVNSLLAPLNVGDLWYDSNDKNRAYSWTGTAWSELANAYAEARVTSLEQTKIGYATLNATGLVFDNDGAITNKADVDAWNTANPGDQATWHVGLPFATAVKQVGVTNGDDTLTLEQRFVAQKLANEQLYGQYTVKIDNKGHVTGFGLASGTVDGTPSSAFIVRADRFGIAGVDDVDDQLGTLAPTRKPFMVLTEPLQVDGKTYPAGTWIDTAFIANATITSAQITSLTADKITAGAVSAALGLTTGKLWGGVAISSNMNNGTFGQLLYPFATTNFGTGFFLGNDGGTYKFYVGAPTQNMNWNGETLSVTGTLNATSGSFRNITVYDSQDRVILSSGGVPYDIGISGTKPPADATRNKVTYGASAPSNPVNGDVWVDTSANPYVIKVRVGGAWEVSSSYVTNTDQLTDGAGLGNTANWLQVANRPETLAALDATAASDLDGKTVTFYQNSAPTGTANDLWFDTNDGNKLYRHNGTDWVVVQDQAIIDAAELATTAQATADGKVVTFYGTSAPTAEGVGDLWYNEFTRELRRWNGTEWQTAGNYVNDTDQLNDGANLGQTANWLHVVGRPETLAALDATAATDLDGKTVTYYQNDAPTGTVNDLWFDTNDGNKLYRHNGTTWEVVQDAGIAAAADLATTAQATADGKVATFYGASAPTPEGVGDLWYNTSTRVLSRWDGSVWQSSGNLSTEVAGNGTNVCNPRYATFGESTLPPVLPSNGVAVLDTSVGYFDAKSLRLTASAGDNYCYLGSSASDYNFPVTGGKSYIVSGYVRVNAASSAGQIYLRFNDSAQTHLGFNFNSSGSANTWSRVSGVITAPATATKALMRVDNDGGAGRVMWVDALMVEQAIGLNTQPSAFVAPPNFLTTYSGSLNATTNTVFRQATAPTGATVNDLWFNTSTAAVYYWNGSDWILAGDVTSQNQAASIVNQGGLATQSSVFIGDTVKIYNPSTSSYQVLNTGDFVNTLTKIGTGNISSFISDAAIGNAYIGNLDAAKITAGTIAADRLDADVITGKVVSVEWAKITNAAITNAQISNLAVSTLKIQDNAVTVPLISTNYTVYDGTTSTIFDYTFNIGAVGKAIVLWQAETDSTRWCYWRVYLNGNQIGYNRAGGAFQDAPVVIAEGNVTTGNNTVTVEWVGYDEGQPSGSVVQQQLVILGAKK